jgi:hypothetical protein
MQEKKLWTLVALAGLTALTLVRPGRDLEGYPASRPFRTPPESDGTVSGSSSISGGPSATTSPQAGSEWLLFRADWSAVLWRVYQKMNDNRLLAVAAGVVFYGLLAVFPAITAFVSLYGLMADPATIHERLSLAMGNPKGTCETGEGPTGTVVTEGRRPERRPAPVMRPLDPSGAEATLKLDDPGARQEGKAMSYTSMMRPIVPVAFASMFAALSPTLAHSASLFICNVTAADGGCVNGTSTTAGSVTFDFSGFLAGDSFVGGLPATSPAQAAASGKIDFSFSWHTLSPGVDTPEQTIFFTSGRLVDDVLDYASSVSGGAGRDFMNISGYVLPLAYSPMIAFA